MVNVLAIDMGSSSVRGYVGQTDGTSLKFTEVYRHPHQVIKDPTGLIWDVNSLFECAVQACNAATKYLGTAPDAVAVDGWGVDCVPVDAEGNPCGKAFAYRDSCGTQGRKVLNRYLKEKDLFERSGVMPQDINTVNRLALYGHGELELPAETDSIMFLQDVVARKLATAPIEGWAEGTDPGAWASCGVASTSGILDSSHQKWDPEILAATKLDSRFLPVVKPEVTEIARRGNTRLLRAGSHDTACAAYSLGAKVGDIFVSCGSWAVVGALTDTAITTEQAYRDGITNEAAVEGNNRMQLNLTGMWLAQECRRYWTAQGFDTSFKNLDRLTEEAPSLNWVFDPLDDRLVAPGEMPLRIARIAREQHGSFIEANRIDLNDPGVILRLIDESVAARICQGIRLLRSYTKMSGQVYLTGGAVHNKFFVNCISQGLGEEIHIAEAEATILGNIAAQLKFLEVNCVEATKENSK